MLASRTATSLIRGVPARATTLQPILLLRSTPLCCPYSTTAASSPLVRQPAILQTLASARCAQPSPLARRAASTSTTTTTTTTANTANAPTTANERPLDWNTFFRLRTLRRRWQLAFSGTMCLGGAAAGAAFLSTGALDSLVTQLPLDPFITLGLMTFGFAALGWLVGPSLGNAAFNLLHRGTKKQMMLKENQFFARIKKNRVDPSNASASNPVPDFYGEKIQSVAGYRQWLKDQRAFNKKRVTFVV